MNLSPSDLITLLRERGVVPKVDPEDWDQKGRSGAEPLYRLAERLQQLGGVTEFQAQQIQAGRANDLVIGPYLLMEPHGAGGMGRVFRAWHPAMDREVAFKLIHDGRHDRRDAVRRFRGEAVAAGRLAHPNVVVAHDAGESDGVLYFVMEFVAGTDLAALVRRRGPLPVAEAAEAARQAALGLQHIHERGLVHRDVKPSNLLRTNTGEIKVADFGLARIGGVDADGFLPSDQIVGTPDYLAPEVSDNPGQVDIRADVYSLGCTLYYLLTGTPPFPGGTPQEKMGNHRDSVPVPLEALRADLPPGLAIVVRRMMSRWPQNRFDTPAEVVSRLAPFASKVSVSGPAHPSSEATLLGLGETPRRSRTIAKLMLGAIVVGAGLVAIQPRGPVDQPRPKVPTAPVAIKTTTAVPPPVVVAPPSPILVSPEARAQAQQHSLRGKELSLIRADAESLVELEKAIELDPTNPRDHHFLGDIFYRRKDYDRAVEAYTRAVRLDPKSAKYLASRGEAVRLAGHPEASLVDFEEAIRLSPLTSHYHRGLGMAKADLGQDTQALALMNRALELDPKDASSYAFRGRLHARMGNAEAARADRDQARLVHQYWNQKKANP